MSKTPSQVTTIGFFILTAVVLLISMLIAFGGSSWLKSTLSYTMFFNSSVKGLSAGSPVMFRGVKIGQVTEIRLQTPGEQPATPTKVTPQSNQVHFPVQVTAELDPEKLGFPNGAWYNFFRSTNFGHTSKDDLEEYLAEMVLKQGLCAKLQTISLLTGQLSIEFTFDPVGSANEDPERLQSNLNQHIFPTRLGFLDQVSNRFGEKNFRSQMESLQKFFAQISDFIENGRSQQFLEDLSAVAANLHELTDTLNQKLPPLLEEGQGTLTDAKGLVANANNAIEPLASRVNYLVTRVTLLSDSARLLLNSLNTMANISQPELETLLKQLNSTVSEAHLAIQDTRSSLQKADSLLDPEAPLRKQLTSTLDDCQGTLGSLKALLETFNRNPQILLLGE